MSIQEIVQKFISNPAYLTNGSGSLAKRWKCSKSDIYKAKEIVKKSTGTEEITVSEIQEIKENKEKGTSEIKFLHTSEVLSEQEIWAETKMDKSKWRFVQVYHKKFGKGFLYTANFRVKDENSAEVFQDNFKTFLRTFAPAPKIIKKEYSADKPKVSVVLPKQDAHFNKFDVYGSNSIESRFANIESKTLNVLQKASTSNSLEEVVYIVGSDQFNSEWTSLTTKGTPQQNILTYEAAFTEICNHEVKIINTLIYYSEKVRVVFVPGNHDQYVGWHLVNWLETYYRNNTEIFFDTSTLNRKYIKYHNSAIQLNHGDALKGTDLAHKFPMEFKEEWSNCDYYYSFVGDKHHEMSKDIHGIKFYQIPQLSNAKSYWDDKQGHTSSKAEMTAFVITSTQGLTDIYKEIL